MAESPSVLATSPANSPYHSPAHSPARSPARTPESLRNRQRDRLSPRGRFTNTVGLAAPSGGDQDTFTGHGDKLSSPSRTKTAGSRSPELMRKKLPRQEGLRKKSGGSHRVKRDTENAKFDITPDGGSGGSGREGRQFTVANVGNNGRIYLRPTIRPAHQRYPPPSFVFPVTPPSTAGLDALVSRDSSEEARQNDDSFTATPSSSTAKRPGAERPPLVRTPSQFPRHRRALSESTVDGGQHPIDVSETGDFKVIIERPRPRGLSTSEHNGAVPTLEVPIPSYRIGTPRFSVRGTVFFRGSSYSTADDMRSSIFSHRDHPSSQRDPSSHRPTRIISRRHSDASPQPHIASMPSQGTFDPAAVPSPPTIMKQQRPILPEIYDALTFKPACDHPSVVRYSMNGSIKAATPARIVAEITSPTFVDYDLLSDFFLTYRSFLSPDDLLHMLIARLRWALGRSDEVGTVVRVRTFVAIRHWILNYFLDDFVLEYWLRKSFCDLLNAFVDELCQDEEPNKAQLKLLGEIKKCWRRVCALYWDGPEFDIDLGVSAPITPGGIAGHRDPNLDPSFWEEHPEGPPRLDGIIEPEFVVEQEQAPVHDHNFFADVSRAGRIPSFIASQQPVIQHPQAQPQTRGLEPVEPPLSPTSIVSSEDFVSCSFPTCARIPGTAHPLGAHPVQAVIRETAQLVATTPKALTGKRVRPAQGHSHKRSGSFSDSIRDNRMPQQPVQKVLYKSTELLLALPYAGSLVRGNVLPPAEGYVEAVAPGTPSETNRLSPLPRITVNQKAPAAMSGPGMRKLLGSVRRALSTRTPSTINASPTLGSFPNIPPLGARGATINRLPGTAVVPQAKSKNTTSNGQPRIDLLGAEVAEHFKKAVREDADIESGASSGHRSMHSSLNRDAQVSSAPDIAALRPPSPRRYRDVNSEMSTGSKSILIVDGTTSRNMPVMSGALSMSRSMDTFTDAFMQPSAGPTPPSTPPGRPAGTPRRSSHLLGHQNLHGHSFDRDSETVYSQAPQDRIRIVDRGLTGQYSMGPSYRAKRSVSLRRYASYHSGFTRADTRSFDATTVSGEESNRVSSPVPPLPLRVLRRRPGGDLRAASHVGQLNHQVLRRTASTGSLAYSESIRSSYMLDEETDSYVEIGYSDIRSAQDSRQFSLGALAEAPPVQQRISLFSTHSSQPNMRPSFEKEAQLLAQIPDDEDDDGGVESALLKLEGKFEQRRSDASNISIPREMPAMRDSFGVPIIRAVEMSNGHGSHDRRTEEPVIEEVEIFRESDPNPATYHPQHNLVEELKPTVYKPTGMLEPQAGSRSVESYSSIPLLDRESTYEGLVDAREARGWSEISILRESSSEREDNRGQVESAHPSYDFIEKAEAMESEAPGGPARNSESINQSFLDSDSGDRSDLSSEMSMEVISRTEYTAHDSLSTSTFPPLHTGSLKDMELPTHPLHHPSTPPVVIPTNQQSSTNKLPHIGELVAHQPHKVVTPPTPDITPTAVTGGFGVEKGALPTEDPQRSYGPSEPSRKTSSHLPFILAFDSLVLAQQFTLIEKDALNEIDWKDLIEMRWKETSTESRSWVEFLRTNEPKGIEVVIARFNLMVKWAMSEIVLTQDLEERVRCITKYIHVAAHCRKLRNFATMTQLTVALTSKDISRLTDTWSHVAATDLQTLRELESLVTPSSNFYSLRAEMECVGVDQGCIPFVGIYTHDLLVNSERPSQIASTPTTEPLVNFERRRTDATIVKNLLRLLEASLMYRFLPIEGITERCLWMAALSDEEITKYGKMIQK
ncbi:hypothetical protein F5884DRAFT_658671 [Xylogone sp. PMI_703]|nr:hypothetical protein F5884DRAFT_658671 [Xylogone sp. PMI_703]